MERGKGGNELFRVENQLVSFDFDAIDLPLSPLFLLSTLDLHFSILQYTTSGVSPA